MEVCDYLKSIDYPGRFIVIGYDEGGFLTVLYGITARSIGSRNRVLRLYDGVLKTEVYDESIVIDPSLLIYTAKKVVGNRLVITNGNHLDTIEKVFLEGGDLKDALSLMTYEPDAPSYTPRISGVVNADGSYSFSIVKRVDEKPERYLYHFEREIGIGHIIHTYMGNGSPLPSFTGLPVRVDIKNGKDAYSNTWASLYPENRVALYLLHGSEEMVMN